MPRRRMTRRTSRGFGLGRIKSSLTTGIIGDAVKGIGGGTVAGVIANRTVPRYAPIANLAGGFLVGGIWGGIINALFSGAVTGLNLAGITGGGNPGGRNLAL